MAKSMTLANQFLNRVGGLGAAAFIRNWMNTLDFRATFYDRTADPAQPGFSGPVIGLVWHEYLITPLAMRGNNNGAILTSRHRDAEWLTQAAHHLGFHTFRGSTARGGSQALLNIMRDTGTKNLGIAADGPLGPRRHLAPGPIYLSSRLQIPLVVFAVGYDRPWRMPTWDRFAVPRPGSRARMILGPRFQVPPNLERPELEQYRVRMERLFLHLTAEAESWAETNHRREGQQTFSPAPGSRQRHSDVRRRRIDEQQMSSDRAA